MIRSAFIAAMALALVACNATGSRDSDSMGMHTTQSDANTPPPVPANDLPARSVLNAMPDFNGIGPLRFGMSVEQMRRAWGMPLYGEAPVNDSQACYYLRPSRDKYDLQFMVEGDRFVRVDVKTAEKTAPGGGRVGMDIIELRKLYDGRIKASPNFYDSAATDLRVTPSQPENALLLFEANEKDIVTSWRVGKPQQVNYVEGCG